MDFKIVPSAPYLHKPRCVVTPNGGLLYIAPKNVVYIEPYSKKTTPEIKQINIRQIVKDLDVDPAWGKPSKHFAAHGKDKQLFAVAADDRTIQIFDLKSGQAISGHKAHVNRTNQHEGDPNNRNGSFVHISYMRNGNLLSVDNHDFVLYCVASNTYHRSPLFINTTKQQITALKCSPFNEHTCAFGTSRGIVLVCNIKKCQILYSLRGHLHPITSFVWKIVKKPEEKESPAEDSEKGRVMRRDDDNEPFDIYNYDYLQSEFGAPVRRQDQQEHKVNPNIRLPPLEDVESVQSLSETMEKIKVSREEAISMTDPGRPCSSKQEKLDESSSIGNSIAKHDSSLNSSIEIVNYSSSDDGNVMDGDHRKPKKEILHHIYHQAEVHAVAGESTNEKSKATITEPNKSSTGSEGSLDAPDLLPDDRNENVEVDEGHEILLLSIAEDFSCWIWNPQTGAVCEGMNKLGHGKNHHRHADIVWLDDLTIMASDVHNCIMVWKPEYKPRYASPRYDDKDKFKSKIQHIVSFALVPGTKKMWCISKERKILFVDLKLEKSLLEIGTVSCGIRTISECPLDMNKIFLGLMDTRMVMFDTSKITKDLLPIQNFSSLHSPITCSAWCHFNTRLAFGSADGKVGVLDIEFGKLLVEFRPKFSKEIYSMAWIGDYLYFVCNGSVCVHNCDEPKEDAVIAVADAGHATSVTTRSQFLFVGTQDGQVVVYKGHSTRERPKFVRVARLLLLSRYITMMTWSPLKENVVAVVGNDNQISILKFNPEAGSLAYEDKLMSPSKAALITWVKWSNFKENLFLTNDRQGNLIIWDLSRANKMLLIKEFPCPITSAIFMPTDENTVMCSGTALPLIFVDFSGENVQKPVENIVVKTVWATKSGPEIHETTASEKRRARKARRRELKKSANAANESVDPNADEKQKDKKSKDKEEKIRSETKERDANDIIEEAHLEEEIKNEEEKPIELLERSVDDSPLKNNPHNYKAHPATIMYLSAKDLNRNPLDKLYIALTGDKNEILKSTISANLFYEKEYAQKLLLKELKHHKNLETRPLASLCFNMMNRELLREEMLKCIENRTLSEWHVSMAPTFGVQFWNYISCSYAFQLFDQGYVLQGATYMMACHREIDAVNYLLARNFYQEALLLCRVTFLDNTKQVSQCIDAWLDDLESKGNVQAAALICILSKRYRRGFQFLRKIRNRTDQIVELLELIKQKGNLYCDLGEEEPEGEVDFIKKRTEREMDFRMAFKKDVDAMYAKLVQLPPLEPYKGYDVELTEELKKMIPMETDPKP